MDVVEIFCIYYREKEKIAALSFDVVPVRPSDEDNQEER
jgi:hypothetical protein